MKKISTLLSGAALLLISNLPANAQFTTPKQTSSPISSSGALGQSILPNLGSMTTAFIRPAAGAFTFVNQSGASLTDNSSGGALTLKPVSRGTLSNLISLVIAQPATPYTITALMQRLGPTESAQLSGIILTDGTKSLLFGIANFATDGTTRLLVGRYVTAVLTTATPFTVGFSTNTLTWLRVVNDGTNLTYSISYDRIEWKIVFTELVGSFLAAITQIGWGADTNDNGGSGQFCYTQLWYWVVS